MVIAWVVPPRDEPGKFKPYLQVKHIATIAESYSDGDGEAIADKIAATARDYGCPHVDSDQREALFLGAGIRKRGLVFTERTWTAQSKPVAVERVRRWLTDGVLALPEHDRLRRELLGFEERVNASGMLTFGARGSGHDDFVALLITAAMAEVEGALVPDVADGPAGKLITPASRWSNNDRDDSRHTRGIPDGVEVTIHDGTGTRRIISGGGGGWGSVF
jgi:hypothetical protein